jgi:hypothetical protein
MHPANRNFVPVGPRNYKCTAEASKSFQQSTYCLKAAPHKVCRGDLPFGYLINWWSVLGGDRIDRAAEVCGSVLFSYQIGDATTDKG